MEKVTLTKKDGTKVEKMLEKPKYGGVFTGGLHRPPTGSDDAYSQLCYLYLTRMVMEDLLIGDWRTGSQGTAEASWLAQGTFFLKHSVGNLAESWEVPDRQTVIYHIRKGVHFQNKPPVNGRQMNADDVAASIQRFFDTPKNRMAKLYGKYFKSVAATDKWTVVVKSIEGNLGDIFKQTQALYILPTEIIEEYGDITDWKVVVGTGPFMLKDYIPGSSVTLERNPNYWGMCPLFPENQLPYLDGIMWLEIPDNSTRMAAIRTAKIDWVPEFDREAAAALRRTNPELKYARFLASPHYRSVFMRMDKELPFHDIRVRRAMSMAIDQQAIKDDYYGGEAELLTCPVQPFPEFMHFYTPLEELPRSVQELYEYHPDKAKQLLAEAGYPDGFKTKIVCEASKADLVSILVAQWADIGVDVEIDVREWGVWTSIRQKRAHEEMLMSVYTNVGARAPANVDPDRSQNASMVDDPRCNELIKLVEENIVLDNDKVDQALKVEYAWQLEQAWHVETPNPYVYCVWQPWVKGYGGEWTVGHCSQFNFVQWTWYDQDLKEEMTGLR